jgi:hypothetical protein
MLGLLPMSHRENSAESTVCGLEVLPDLDAPDWFWVMSRTRAGLLHLVDIAYQDEPWRTPYEACSCEAFQINLYTMGKICPHIRAVRKYRRDQARLQKTSSEIEGIPRTPERISIHS